MEIIHVKNDVNRTVGHLHQVPYAQYTSSTVYGLPLLHMSAPEYKTE